MEYKAFKDLTKEERSEIVEAKLRGEVEFLDSEVNEWEDSGKDLLVMESTYRIKPAKMLNIPWDVIKPEYNWAAVDSGGAVNVFTEKPVLGDWCWHCVIQGDFEPVYALNIDTTGISWENSLTQRPE